MSVGENLKTDLNSAGPLVLKSSYATQKYIQIENIYIYTFVFIEKKNPGNPEKIGIAKKKLWVLEKNKEQIWIQRVHFS